MALHLTSIFLLQTALFTETIPDSAMLSCQETGWDPEPVWKIWGSGKPLVTAEIRTPDRQTYIVVATLFRLDDRLVGKYNSEEMI
jgi:hypothetical protein